MLSLRERQQQLAGAILSPAGPARGSSEKGLGVYRNAYRSRLAGALRLNYPTLAGSLSEAEFLTLANRYAQAFPPAHYSIRWYGDQLAEFLPPGPMEESARLDWALGLAFDAADARTADMESLADFPAESLANIAFSLHPSVSVLLLQWAVEPQWVAVRESRSPPAAFRNSHGVIVFRHSLQSRWRIADVAEAHALRALAREGTLQRTCEAFEREPQEIGEWFARWLNDGLLVQREPAT